MRYIHLQKYVRPMKRMNVKREVEMMMMKTVSVQECAAFSFQHRGGRQRRMKDRLVFLQHTHKKMYIIICNYQTCIFDWLESLLHIFDIISYYDSRELYNSSFHRPSYSDCHESYMLAGRASTRPPTSLLLLLLLGSSPKSLSSSYTPEEEEEEEEEG